MRGPPGPHHLLDDLPRGQVAAEPRLSGGAKYAPHGAPRLTRYTHCRPVRIPHKDRLDARLALEGPEPFHRLPAVRDGFVDQTQGGWQGVFEPRPQRPRQVGHLRRPTSLLV